MLEQVVRVRRLLVVFGGEARQAILVNEAVELGEHLRDQDVHPEIELLFINKVRKRLVLLYDVALVAGYVANLLRQENAFPLTTVDRLHNESHRLFALHEIYEVV